ncbi:hypothetical protein [Carnobacterium maltaromaticum]|uniref:hypothetical protein n=1 Tax=Carnobacterium maltaromaticum TaxID=2751 RepID=UPI0012F8701B|nr:hypothetical protein [Carnobacterium maltaromaticum]
MNFADLGSFMSNDFPILVGALFCFFALKAWKGQDWLKFAGSLVFAAVIIGVAKGSDIWSFVNGILKWFGLNL